METRINRKDRVLLEALTDKYGRDLVATAMLSIANLTGEGDGGTAVGEEGNSCENCVLDFIKFLEGARIRMRELHWQAEKNSEHKLTDDIISTLEGKEDEIAEDFMGICNFRIKVGQVVPIMPESKTTEDLLRELVAKATGLKTCIGNDVRFTGIENIVDDLLHYLNKSKYLETMF